MVFSKVVYNIFYFVFKRMGARFREIYVEEIQKLTGKAVNTNTVKTTECCMNVWKSWAESKDPNDHDIVEYKAKELNESLPQFFAEIRKSNDLKTLSLNYFMA